ncbi:MAG: prenyltransferase/squalene oxidase repeat-containing protein [Planctomycetota bacterium]|jgi:squalene-hopene/tetraprenyl-beta-curcumene cyclase
MRIFLVLALSLCCLAAAELPSKAQVAAAIDEAQAWFLAQQQENGAFTEGTRFDLGAALVAIEALTSEPQGLAFDHPAVAKTLAYIDGHIRPDGSVQDGNVANYTTSLALMVWARGDLKDAATVKRAQDFLLGLQNTDEADLNYGGIGYGSSGPTFEDLNNTTYAVEALRESGLPADHPAMQRALQFVQRCQNLSSHNDLAWAGNDGGAVYAPHQSKAGGSWSEEEQAKAAVERARSSGKLESYGTMTYNLINTYLILDLTPEDPRLRAALEWCRANYQFEVNPGMPAGQEQQGLYYYYQMLAKTFAIIDQAEVNGQDWRVDLYRAFTSRRQGDAGSAFWVNQADRWGEGLPIIPSSYVLKGLKRIHASLD